MKFGRIFLDDESDKIESDVETCVSDEHIPSSSDNDPPHSLDCHSQWGEDFAADKFLRQLLHGDNNNNDGNEFVNANRDVTNSAVKSQAGSALEIDFKTLISLLLKQKIQMEHKY